MRTHLLAALLGLSLGAAALTGCVIGAPPGFSEGDSWTLPLVDPLADGRLVTPVMIDGKGPFLFAIDPDAHFTTADRAIAAIAGVPARPGQRVRDEDDHTHPTWYAQLPNVKLGSLGISLLRFGLVDNGSFDADGRRIWGVIGRDVIADSLVFTIDRDRGEARITVNNKFVPPAGAHVVPYDKLVPDDDEKVSQLPGGKGATANVGMLSTTRYMVKADIDGQKARLHMDLGDAPSQLAPEKWAGAKLQPTPWPMELIDEAGTHHKVTEDGIAQRVTVPGEDQTTVVGDGIGFVPFGDKRWLSGQIDGTLGLDFFRPYIVSADWQHQIFYLSPRQASPAVTAQRLARWGTALVTQCKIAGCATASAMGAEPPPQGEMGMADPASTPATGALSQQAIFNMQRDPMMNGHNLELVFAATSADGKPLPMVYVDLDAGTATFDAPIDPRYANAHFEVADLSPYPRACANHAPACMRLAPAAVP